MSVKSDIWDKINKKAAQAAEAKQKTSRNKELDREIIDFFKEVNEAINTYQNNSATLYSQCSLLDGKLKGRILSRDPNAQISISFNIETRKHGDIEYNYITSVNSVDITWSQEYAEKNQIPQCERFDPGCLIYDLLGL